MTRNEYVRSVRSDGPPGSGVSSASDTKSRRLLSVNDVASRLVMSSDWVYRKARAGEIPHVRIGTRVRFRAEDIEDFIARCREQHDNAE